jgi:hypothetical protein
MRISIRVGCGGMVTRVDWQPSKGSEGIQSR